MEKRRGIPFIRKYDSITSISSTLQESGKKAMHLVGSEPFPGAKLIIIGHMEAVYERTGTF